MAITISTTTPDSIQQVASAGTLEGSTSDISDAYEAGLYVYYGPDSTTAVTVAAEAHIQVSPEASGDDTWNTYTTLSFGTTTAESEALTGTENAGATVLEVASTTNLTSKDIILIKNSTIGNSEFAQIASIVTNTSITVFDGITNAQTGSTVYDQAERRFVQLPALKTKRVRVLYFGATGPTVCFMSRLTKTTAL